MDFIKNKKNSILFALISLAIPTIIEEILSTLLQYVDTAMVGQLGEKATASVSVTTTIGWLSFCVPAAFAVGTQTLIAQSYGRKDFGAIKTYAKSGIIMAFIFGLIMEIICIVLAPFIPIWMGAENSIQKDASTYFIIILIPFFLRSIQSVMAGALRGVKDSKTPMVISLISNILNVALNYLFIYALSMGVIGAAIGSAIAYAIGGILMFIAFGKNQLFNTIYSKEHFDKTIASEILKLAIPLFASHVASCAGYVVFAAQVTTLGTTTFAAHSIAVTAEQIFYIAGYGLRAATSTLVGIAVGEKNQKKYDKVCRSSLAFTLGMQCITGFLLFVTAYPLMSLFTSSDEVARIGASVLKIVAFSEPFYGLMIVAEGIFYGLGNTKLPFITELFGMWVIRIIPTYIFVHYIGATIEIIWYFMIADNIIKTILLLIPLIRKKSIQKVLA
ncbi:MAG: MATE family efflux transporter [Lachnospiraceae bacterium]|nr:MATE family efflux transporter [Lachnospiraceae bacterium]